MSNSFEQNFMNNVRTNVNTASTAGQSNSQTNNKNFFTVLILSIVILIEAVAIIILAFLLKSYHDEYIVDFGDDIVDYTYNDDGSIRTMSFTCESETEQYLFYPTGDYEKWDLNFNQELDAGTYSLIENTVLIDSETSDAKQSLDFNDNIVTEDTTRYICDRGALYDDSVEE